MCGGGTGPTPVASGVVPGGNRRLEHRHVEPPHATVHAVLQAGEEPAVAAVVVELEQRIAQDLRKLRMEAFGEFSGWESFDAFDRDVLRAWTACEPATTQAGSARHLTLDHPSSRSRFPVKWIGLCSADVCSSSRRALRLCSYVTRIRFRLNREI